MSSNRAVLESVRSSRINVTDGVLLIRCSQIERTVNRQLIVARYPSETQLYDVAVVGAGPAGSTAARYLAKEGLSVCLIDKDNFPRDKPCGGGFSETLLNEFSYLEKRRSDFLRGVARAGVLHSPNRRIILRGKVDMALTKRVDFDNVLYELAVEAGVEPYVGERAKTLVLSEEKTTVRLSTGRTLESRFVIGADGVNSTLARQSSLNRRWPSSAITACRVVEIPARMEDILDRYTSDLDYHFYANLGGLPGYGWVFPKEGTINVGLGIVANHSHGLPGLFHCFVKHLMKEGLLPKDADISGTKGALVPTGGPLDRTVKGRCLLLGDAAGMVSPLTGGGIGYAMRAAKHAARAVVDALEDDLSPSNLASFHNAWYNDFGNDFRKQLLAQKVFTGSFTNLLFEIGKRDPEIQAIVSEGMSESSNHEIDIGRLLLRTLLVCLRGSLGLE